MMANEPTGVLVQLNKLHYEGVAEALADSRLQQPTSTEWALLAICSLIRFYYHGPLAW